MDGPHGFACFRGWLSIGLLVVPSTAALYWLPTIKEEYRLHRTFNFLIKNGGAMHALPNDFSCLASSTTAG